MEEEIYEKVEKYVKENLANMAFDKAYPYFQNFANKVGEEYGISGEDVARKYFDIKNKR